MSPHPHHHRGRLPAAILLLTIAVLATAGISAAHANTSHEGWPQITGVLLMNKRDQDRPLDVRPGQDIFAGADASYSCDGLHRNRSCARASGLVSRSGHNELLGGHGDDTIHAGPQGDVLWGDYKPSGQPSSQVDHMTGGLGNDFIYASHGRNDIDAGRGDDTIHAHFGRGSIDCGGGTDVLFVSRQAQTGYRISNCETISHTTLGY